MHDVFSFCERLAKRFFPSFAVTAGALALVFLAGCTARTQPKGVAVPVDQAVAAWNAYDLYASDREAENAPYRLNASVRFGKEGDTRRVVVLIWSNGEAVAAGVTGAAGREGLTPAVDPIRMDVMAGMGSVVARLREARGEFVAYTPGEASAMVYNGRGRVRVNIGTPLPFGLRDFTALLRGRFHEVFGPVEGTAPVFSAKGNIIYTLVGGDRQGTLELRPDGLPVRWEENGKDGWIMDLDYEVWEGEFLQRPYKISLADADGRSAILLVKNREMPPRRFTTEQLALPLPPDTRIEQVREGRR